MGAFRALVAEDVNRGIAVSRVRTPCCVRYTATRVEVGRSSPRGAGGVEPAHVIARRRSSSPTRASAWVLAALLGLAAVAAVAYPLLVYSVTLASFGLAHVLVELRVLDVRYRRVLGAAALRLVVLALALVFAARCAATAGWITRALASRLELLAGCASVLVLVPRALRRRGAHAIVTVAVAAALVSCVLFVSPVATLLVLAVLHNLTPWPLVAATTEPARRRRVAWRGAIVFVAVPLLIATGLPFALLRGLAAPEASVLPTGPLFEQFSAFWGPAPLEHPALAMHVFCACAYLQCAHYLFVLCVLPSHAPAAQRVDARVVATLVGVGLVVALAYAVDFVGARAWYGTLAGVHAWAEFPALLLALDAFWPQSARSISHTP